MRIRRVMGLLQVQHTCRFLTAFNVASAGCGKLFMHAWRVVGFGALAKSKNTLTICKYMRLQTERPLAIQSSRAEHRTVLSRVLFTVQHCWSALQQT